jgi:regulatory protein
LEAEQPKTAPDRTPAAAGDRQTLDPDADHAHGPGAGDARATSAGDRQAPEPSASDRLEHALALAYRHLNRRDRTVSEMQRHLQGRGCDPDEIEAAIGTLAEQGYLDDARYARLFAEDKRELEQWGSERIQRALLDRGVDRELVEQALAVGATGSEISRAVALLKRRFPTPPQDRRERERALGVLLRKGYESEVALDALVAYADCAEPPPVLRCW